jgi:uncharacterized membrane protein
MAFPRSLTIPVLLFLCAPVILAQSNSTVTQASLTFTTIDVPGMAVTEVNGINTAGDVVGFYGQSTIGPLRGFVYSNGTFTYFGYPSQQVTVPGGINDSGLIVGYATQNANRRSSVVGFLYDGTTFTMLKDGQNQVTDALGINNAGAVVGAAGTLGSTNGFEFINGRYKVILFPGQHVSAFANGINNLGEIVGFTIPAADQCPGIYECGYAYKAGKFQNVDFPGALETAALGVNDNGIIVGWYGIAGPAYYGFAQKGGKYISFGYPGAMWTFALGINNSGQIVGTYSFDGIAYHGFVTSPITAADFEEAGCCQVAVVEGR